MEHAYSHQGAAKEHGCGHYAIQFCPEQQEASHPDPGQRKRERCHSSLGMKMKRATTTAVIAATSTAPAARSLINLMVGCVSGWTRSAILSRQVFSISAIHTPPVTTVR